VITITGILIHNAHIIDPGEQAIKVNPVRVGFVDYGTIECCANTPTDFGHTQIHNGIGGGTPYNLATGGTLMK
jgi:hypothetical protein